MKIEARYGDEVQALAARFVERKFYPDQKSALVAADIAIKTDDLATQLLGPPAVIGGTYYVKL